MAIKARINNENQLLLTGKSFGDTQALKDSIILSAPLKSTDKVLTIGKPLATSWDKNLLDYSTWDADNNTRSGFYSTGDANEIVRDYLPHGNSGAVWECLGNDIEDDAEGGWNISFFDIDNTKLYRCSQWIKRKTDSDGSLYFGVGAAGDNNGLYDHTNAGGTLNTNPYFDYKNELVWANDLEYNTWYLVVSFLHPHDSTKYGDHTDSGWYKAGSNTKLLELSYHDWRFDSTSNLMNLKSIAYYSTDPELHVQWAEPRIDLCDGSEPSVEDLLNGFYDSSPYHGSKVRYIRDYVNGSTQNTNNHWVQIQAINRNGLDAALGVIATGTTTVVNAAYITDGVLDTAQYAYTDGGALEYVQLDLTYAYDLREIKVWHYYSDSRTYHNTLTEVSSDGILWHNIWDSVNHGEYAETSSGVLRPLNLQTTTGCTVNTDGLYVESAMNNYLTGGLVGSTGENADYWTGTSKWNQPINTFPGSCIRFRAYMYTSDDLLDDNLSYISNRSVMFSVYLRKVKEPGYGELRIWDSINYYKTKSIYITKEFQRFEISASICPSATRVFLLIHPAGDERIDAHSIQLETNAYASGYTLGWHSSADDGISFPVNLAESSSIYFKYKAQKELYSLSILSNNKYNDLWWGIFINPNGYLYMHEGHNGYSVTTTYRPPVQEWIDILISWSASGQYLFINGNQIAYIDSGVNNSTNIPYIYIGGGWNAAQAEFKDLVVYNKMLSNDEIEKIRTFKGELTSNGDLIAPVIESGCRYPRNESIYFASLIGISNSDTLNIINPSTDTTNNNFLSEDGAYVGGNQLQYSLNVIGLDWNSDWSICYYKKPIGTELGEEDLSGFNVESFGASSNSVGGGYLILGKDSGQDEMLGTTSNAAFTASDYFDHWQVITIVKTDGDIIINIYLIDGVIRQQTVSVGTIATNYYVNQYGYDLALGGQDDNNGCYSYYKNLLVAERALTEDELNKYRNTAVQVLPNGFRVSNTILENRVLI